MSPAATDLADPRPARRATRGRVRAGGGWERLGEDLRVVLPSWLSARIFVALAYILAIAVAEHWVPGGRTVPMQQGLLAWDGAFYHDIAQHGYLNLPHEALRFFPLYPLLGRALTPFALGDASIALVALANACSLAAAVVTRRLVLFEKQDPVLAERAVWLTALFPSAFVLVWAYAEALFLLCALATFLFARKGRYELAAVVALLAALCRPVGVLLALPLAIEGLRTWRRAGRHEQVSRVIAVVAPVAGLGLYLGWVGRRFGDPLLPFTVQDELRGSADPITRLLRGIGDVVGVERFGDGLHVPFAIAFVVLAVVTARHWPASYTAFAAAVLVAAVSAQNLNSVERYALNAFPLLLTLAVLLRPGRLERLGLAVCGSGLVALAALAWLAVYVP